MTTPAHPQTRRLFVLQCQTCKNTNCPIFTNEKDRYFIQEKSWCEEKYRDFVSKVNLCGCASHSSAQSRDQVLELLNDLRKYANGEYKEADLSDNEHDLRIHLEYENRIWEVMQKLRTHQEAQR